MKLNNRDRQMYNDLIEIFNEEYIKRNLITPQNTAEKLTAKGYRKASEVAEEICGFIREDLSGFVDKDYLERLIEIYKKKYTKNKGE